MEYFSNDIIKTKSKRIQTNKNKITRLQINQNEDKKIWTHFRIDGQIINNKEILDVKKNGILSENVCFKNVF